MADDKLSKKRGKAPVIPLMVAEPAPKPVFGKTTETAVPAPANAPKRAPVAAKVAAKPVVTPAAAPEPAITPPSPIVSETPPVIAEPAPVAAPEPIAISTPDPAPEPVMTEPVMLEPAPAEAAAISPSPEPEPAFHEATAPAELLSKGLKDMATAFQPVPAAETAEKAKAVFGDINGRAKAAMEKSAKLGEEMTELTKGNVEALIQSSRVAAKGAEALAQDAAETMKKNFESATATMKSFASVKSPTELFQLQSEAAKSYFDSAVADMSKFTEQMMKLAGDVAQPLSSRYSVAMEKVKATAL